MSVSLKGFLFTVCTGLAVITSAQSHKLINERQTTICNPVSLSYRFCLDTPSRREAADPTMVLFKNEYYLFASKSGGYFHSTDLINWDLITTNDLPLEDYAPTAVVIKDTIYFMASAGAPLKFIKRQIQKLVNGIMPTRFSYRYD